MYSIGSTWRSTKCGRNIRTWSHSSRAHHFPRNWPRDFRWLSMSWANALAVSGIDRAGEAFARDLLGTGGGVCAERADQRADRAGLSGGSDRALDRKGGV